MVIKLSSHSPGVLIVQSLPLAKIALNDQAIAITANYKTLARDE